MSKPSTLVCFDLGGVVVRICRNWAQGCAAAGIEVRGPEQFAKAHLRETRQDLVRAHQIGELDSSEYFRRIAETTEGLYTPEEIERVHTAWLLDEYTGVLQLVEQLNATPGVRTACLSNTNAHHWDKGLLEPDRYPAIRALHARHASHELRCAKPDAAIYRELESREGLTGEQIVFFDDLADNIAAATAAGWRAHHIDHEADTAAQMRTYLESVGVLT